MLRSFCNAFSCVKKSGLFALKNRYKHFVTYQPSVPVRSLLCCCPVDSEAAELRCCSRPCRKRKDSPRNSSCSTQPNKQDNPPRPTSDFQYVTQPGHPMYGKKVRVLEKRQSRTYTRCVIADPHHPSFHYHLNQRWLSATAPVSYAPATAPNAAIAVPLAALDKLVQLVLNRQQLRRTSHHATTALPTQSDLAADSQGQEEPVEPSSFSPDSADSGRDPS